MKESLVIFLHGVGSRGDDLEPLGEIWAEALPRTAFAAPDAPFAFDGGGRGRQWFSIAGVTEANRPARIVDVRADFDAVIGGLMAAHGLADRPDRVALVGFSQGSIMALDAVASGRWPLAGVVAFSGRLASAIAPSANIDSNVLLVHGSADPVIPVAESLRAEGLLTEAGFSARAEVIAGLGHTISQEGMDLAGRFLAEVLY